MQIGRIMVFVMIGARTQPDKRAEFIQTVVSLLEQIRKSRGCISCHIYQKCEDENALCLLQEWTSQEEFESHTHTDSFAILLGAMQLLLKEPPEIKINEIVVRMLEDFPPTAS